MEMVTIRTFDNYFSANILLGRLQEAGISSYLLDEHAVTMYPMLGNAIGGIKLSVRYEDAPTAIALLKEFDEAYLRSATCPDCGANHILLVPKRSPYNLLAAISSYLFFRYPISAENVYQCQECGYESKSLPDNVSEYN